MAKSKRILTCMPRVHGTTVLELMASLGIVGVVLGVAIPNFATLIERNRTTTVANRLIADLSRTRSEAIMAHTRTVFCPSADARTCVAGSNFAFGWIGFQDHDGDASPDAGETVFATAQASDLSGRRVATTAGRRSLRFRPDGRNAGSNLTLRICDAGGIARRLVIVNVGGRARVSTAPSSTAPCP